MKRLISIIFVSCAVVMSLMFMGCKRNSYTIKANTPNATEGEYYYLHDAITGECLDSMAVADNKVVFKGKADSVRIVALLNMNQAPVVLFLEPGTIVVDLDSGQVSGTKLNEDYNKFITNPDLMRMTEQCEALRNNVDLTDDEAIQMEFVEQYDILKDSLQAKINEECMKVYNNHKKDLLGAYILTIASQSMEFEEFDEIMSDADPVISGFQPLAEIYTAWKGTEATQPGHKFVDIEGMDYGTKQNTSLSKMIGGKTAVVDFWASWCRPCREEIESNLIGIYNDYKDKGVTVIGIDVHDKPEDHAKAMAELGIPYPQLIDVDGNGAAIYGVMSIPQIILIDKDGNIVKRNLRGEEIRKALDELLK